MDTKEVALLSVIIACVDDGENVRRKRKRKIWTKPWLLKRNELGFYNNLLAEFRLEDEDWYKNYLRMSANDFDELLSLVNDDLVKQNTHLRDSIPAAIKLALTIRYLATGISFTELQYQYRVHKSTISIFVPKVCEAIYQNLREKYMKVRILLYITAHCQGDLSNVQK